MAEFTSQVAKLFFKKYAWTIFQSHFVFQTAKNHSLGGFNPFEKRLDQFREFRVKHFENHWNHHTETLVFRNQKKNYSF